MDARARSQLCIPVQGVLRGVNQHSHSCEWYSEGDIDSSAVEKWRGHVHMIRGDAQPDMDSAQLASSSGPAEQADLRSCCICTHGVHPRAGTESSGECSHPHHMKCVHAKSDMRSVVPHEAIR